MIKPAIEYKDELQKKIKDYLNSNLIEYSYYDSNYISTKLKGIKVEKNTMQRHQFVSLCKGEVVGYIAYNISLEDYRVYGVQTINFTNNTVVFGIDLRRVIKNIFELYKFRKMNFGVFIGNPIEKSHDRVTVNCGARIVGIQKKHHKLADGEYHDYKLYEILREDYLKEKRRRGWVND